MIVTDRCDYIQQLFCDIYCDSCDYNQKLFCDIHHDRQLGLHQAVILSDLPIYHDICYYRPSYWWENIVSLVFVVGLFLHFYKQKRYM